MFEFYCAQYFYCSSIQRYQFKLKIGPHYNIPLIHSQLQANLYQSNLENYMQKTQVLKLNTSKDNVQAFFDKIKTKLTEVQSKTDNTENYDITMIVKHQSKQSFKSQQKPTQQPSTVKSILSQNDSNIQGSNNKKTKPKIFNEDNQLQSRMLGSELSINHQNSQQNVIKSANDSFASGKKIRQSNKIPSIGSIFMFQRKVQAENGSSSKKKVLRSCEIVQEPEHNVKFEEKNDKQEKESQAEEKASQSSEQQQINEQNLKKSISRKHIDIFPNIQISPAVSGQLYSMRNFNNLKPIRHKRRCSITDESLLSPKTTKMTEEIKQESARNIVESVRSKLKKKSMNKLFQESDCIDEVRNAEDEGESYDLNDRRKKSVNKQAVNAFRESQISNSERKPVVTINSSTSIPARQRQKALVKRSIFDSQNQNRRFQSNITFQAASSSNRVKTTSHLQIQPHPQSLNTQQHSSSSEQQTSSSKSSNEQPQDSVYVIENKLNDCIRLLEKNELSTLEDYLYEFKDKYFYVSNTRIQIKWRLLMAHCKENKKQFERAAINYNNVIDLAKENPKSLTIEPAEVYHRLGVCYTEIGWWNKGILALSEALNRYKKCKNAVKYAQCMNNLGTLYLQASSLSLAEKCFIQSYNLKKSLYTKSNTKLLTSLFNIFECNLLTKNYDQAQKVITVIEQQIITYIPDSEPNKQLYLGGMYRRKGKMEFLRGNNIEAEKLYLKAFERLASRYPYCMQFGELMACLGLLKLEDGKYKEAKQYYDKAIMLMNFYCSKDSVTILTLKKNLQYSVKMIKEERQGSSSKRIAN